MKRVVIVAGGTGTIGGAVCAALAQRGKGVVAVCRHQPAPCDQVCGVDYYARDIMENHAAETLLAYIRCKNYEVEGLVVSLSSETSCEVPKGLAHLGAEIDLVETVVPKMIGGSVVMLSSTAARLPFALGTSRFYAGAKGYVESYVKAASAEFAPGVRINAVAPGVVDWPCRTSEVHARFDCDRVPLKRNVKATEVADAIIFLLGAVGITGVTLPVDGGLTASIPAVDNRNVS